MGAEYTRLWHTIAYSVLSLASTTGYRQPIRGKQTTRTLRTILPLLTATGRMVENVVAGESGDARIDRKEDSIAEDGRFMMDAVRGGWARMPPEQFNNRRGLGECQAS